MPTDFATYSSSLDAPAQGGFAISPSDSLPLPRPTRAIHVGAAGNLSVVMVSGETVTLTGVAAGMIYPLRVTQVRATGTTAASLVGLY